MDVPPDLRTPRLLLRPFRAEDVDDVFAYAADAEWNRYLGLPEPYVRRHAEEYVAQCILTDPVAHPYWAIVHEGRVRGGVNLRLRHPGDAELGYAVARPLWGRGLATEAARAAVAHGFAALALERVSALADVDNAGSWRVMEKLGMRREALFRGYRPLRGERRDCVLYAVLRGEWPAGGDGASSTGRANS